MKISNVRQMSRLDPEDISQASGDRNREVKRKRVIKSFLWWAAKDRQRWNSQNNEERIIVKRQFAYGRMLTVFGLFSNFTIYNCFFSGIYNFRTRELVDMRRVPFLAKFGVSSLIAFSMCKKLWENNIYEAELYEVALKYRDRYDNYTKTIDASSSTSGNITESSGGGADGTNSTAKTQNL